jgi:PKD repeat protein
MRRRTLRLAIVLAAVGGAALLSGCDWWVSCVRPAGPPPPGTVTPFGLLVRAAWCTGQQPSTGNPIVPQFQILQSSPIMQFHPVTAVQSGSVVVLDGSSSYIAAPDDAYDQIQDYSWDFHGDGQLISTSNPYPFSFPPLGSVADAVFTTSVQRQVKITLTATDTLGLTWSVTEVLTVYPVSRQPPGKDAPPVAALTVSPNPAALGQSVTFDGSATKDSQGSVVDYKWDFGDGTAAVDTGANARTAHMYACSGRVTATLTATNDGGQTGQARVVVFVTPQRGSPPCPGSGPAAAFTASPNPARPEMDVVKFDASASSDAAGPITDYFWEFGDGTHADTSSPTITHSYFCTGTLTVKLTIEDGDSMSDQASATESVSPAEGFEHCPAGGARDVAGRSRPVGSGRFFEARFVHTRVLARGVLVQRGSITTLRGLVITGSLRGSLIGSRALARFDQARFVSALTLALDAVKHVITIHGVALATFPGARKSELCLRIAMTRLGTHLPIGSFRALGGTGAAARLSGGGTFAFALGPKGGRLAGRLRVDHSRRAGRRARPLPAACRSLPAFT